MRLRIGVDIDGVLYPWTECVNEALAERYGLELADHERWDWLKGQLTREQWSWVWSAEGQDRVFGCVDRVYPGVVEMVNAMTRAGHYVHFVTHRDPRRTACHTATFLARHFSAHPWAGVHILQNGTPKHELGRWDVFVDDKPATVYDFLALTSARVFAPARPWNADLEPDSRLTRYADPQEVVEWLAR